MSPSPFAPHPVQHSTRSPIRLSIRRGLAVGAAALLLPALAACSGGAGAADEPAARADGSASVVRPGRPGESATTLGADASVAPAAAVHDDIAFAQMMIPHHAQALTMTDLARTRASSPAVKALAQRISAAQRPEILTMGAWLREQGVDVPGADDASDAYDHGDHGHATMHGMLTDAQLRTLARSRGTTFDRLFLQGMIQHHEGAVQMAEVVEEKGADVRISELATEIVAGQGAEIGRMEDLLRRLPA